MWQRTVAAILAMVAVSCSHRPEYYLERAERYRAEKKFDDAELNYRKVIGIDGRAAEAYFGRGQMLWEMGRGQEAYEALRIAADLRPERVAYQEALGRVSLSAYLAGRPRAQAMREQVLAVAGKVAALDANSYTAAYLQGAVALDDRIAKDAIDRFQKALRLRPSSAEAGTGLSAAYFLDGQFELGERTAREALRQDPHALAAYDLLYKQFAGRNRLGDAEEVLIEQAANNPTEAEPILQLARHYLSEGELVRMEDTLRRLTGNPSVFPQAPMQTGNLYLQASMPEKAAEAFRLGLRTYPGQSVTYQKRLATALVRQGKSAEALQVLETVLQAEPKDTQARILRARIWLDSPEAGKLDAALEELQVLVREVADDPQLRWDLIRGYEKKGRLDSAARELTELIRLRGELLPARYALAELRLRQANYRALLEVAEDILRMRPRESRARFYRAVARTGLQEYAAARGELRLLAAEAPENIEVQMQLGLIAIAERQYREAEAIFEKMGRLHPRDPRGALGLAGVELSQEHNARALEILREELRQSPSPAKLRMVLATAAARAGEYALAAEQYRAVLKDTPGFAKARLGLGEVYRRQGNFDAAIAAFERAAQDNPELFTPLLMLANTYEKLGKVADAEKYYRRAMGVRPDPAVMNNLAYLLAETGGNREEALALAQRAVQQMPDEPTLSDTLGYVYLKNGNSDSALRIFQINLNKRPKDPVFRYHLGLARLLSGDKKGAREAFTVALEHAADAELRKRIEESAAGIR